jgi:hypothetical protein
MNEGSISREDFSFDLPFDITLDPIWHKYC